MRSPHSTIIDDPDSVGFVSRPSPEKGARCVDGIECHRCGGDGGTQPLACTAAPTECRGWSFASSLPQPLRGTGFGKLSDSLCACGNGMDPAVVPKKCLPFTEGYTVCYETIEDFIGILTSADYERGAGFRLENIKKAQHVILDEIGYATINREQTNRFFCFISAAYEKRSIIFTTNKEIPEWDEMMGDPVLTTAMMDRILHHAGCFSLKGESYRLKYPELFVGGAGPARTLGMGHA